MKKKLVCALLCTAMTAAAFTGCGSSDGDSSQAKNDNASDASDNAADDNAADDNADANGDSQDGAGKGKVYYLNFKPEQGEDWVELAAKYTEETGVPVDVQTAAAGTYEEQLKSEMAKTEAPTLFQVNGPIGYQNWKDYCYDLKDSEIYKHVKSDDFVLKDGEAVPGIAYVIETYGIIYNKKLLNDYIAMDGAKIQSVDEINSFAKLKEVADDIQAKKDDLGVAGAFTSAGMDSSSDWRFKTHLANIPIYYEYKADNVDSSEAIKGTYLDQYKQMWDLYLTDSTCAPSMISGMTGDDAAAEFAVGDAVFYQNGTWAYNDIMNDGLTDDDIGMLPIYIGVEGEENQGLCTGSENYWCINKNAPEEDIKATLDFLNWVITSDAGRESLANTMGFVTPFDTFDDGYQASNPLLQIANDYISNGKTPVSWNFSTIPSEKWKDDVGSALMEYAQGTGEWSAVEKAFVDGWATEYQAANGGN